MVYAKKFGSGSDSDDGDGRWRRRQWNVGFGLGGLGRVGRYGLRKKKNDLKLVCTLFKKLGL